MAMTRDELLALDKQIAAKREEREAHNQHAVQEKVKAKKLSEEIRALEARLPPASKANGIRLSVEPAKATVKSR